MGVSGCGKSSVGRTIAEQSGWHFIEGDDLHPDANKKKMASGTPLNDQDRWPWLDAIADAAQAIEAGGGTVVIACSALKRAYREHLSRVGTSVRFIYLAGNRDIIEQRMQARTNHFMPPGLLDSQIATLEPPDSTEPAHTFDISMPVEKIARMATIAISRHV
jgi:carbohydrate kinase (thermoresistant glucokinase family)